MPLSLTISNPSNLGSQQQSEVIITDNKATLGRDPECTVHLPCNEKLVSRTHGKILFENGNYFIEDSSANGLFINDASEPLGHNSRYLLCQNDVLILGSFKLTVSLIDAEHGSSNFLNQPNIASSSNELAHSPKLSSYSPSSPGSFDSAQLDSDLTPNPPPPRFNQSAHKHEDYGRAQDDFGDIADHFSPPNSVIPSDWDLDPEPPAQIPPSEPSSKGSVVQFSSRSSKQLQHLLEGLGIDTLCKTESLTEEGLFALGKALSSVCSTFLKTHELLQRSQNELCVTRSEKPSWTNNDPLRDIDSAAALIMAVLQGSGPNRDQVMSAIHESYDQQQKDFSVLMKTSQITSDRFFKELSPTAISNALEQAQSLQSKKELGIQKLNDGFSSSARKWTFFERNWNKIFARAHSAAKKDIESNVFLSLSHKVNGSHENSQ